MPIPAIRESAQAAPFRAAPNYATREETMKAAKRIVDEDAEVFRRLADA